MHLKIWACSIIVICGLVGSTFGQSSCLAEAEKIENTYLGKISAEGYAHEKSLVNLLINKQETTDQRKGLIYHFCDTLLGTRPDGNNMEDECFEYDTYTYDPRQSLFLYTLCVNTEEKNGDLKTYPKRDYKQKFIVKDFIMEDYIEDDLDFNEIWGIPAQDLLDGDVAYHGCNPRLSMQACEFTKILPHMFKEIMNAYTNMKLATIYGYKYVMEDDSEDQRKTNIEKAIQEFSESYFKPPPTEKSSPSDNECGEAGITYISKPSGAGDNKHCTHPKTYDMVEGTITSTLQLIKKVDRLKADKLVANPCINAQENIMSCAFSSKGDYFGDSDWKEFQNLYLNELMYFNMFANYYSNQILNKVTYNPGRVGSVSFMAGRNQREYQAMQNELRLHAQAAYQSMRTLSQVYVSYPLHVAMTAYLEDVLKYRKEFTKLYTSLHQLYYLLRNVQACQD